MLLIRNLPLKFGLNQVIIRLYVVDVVVVSVVVIVIVVNVIVLVLVVVVDPRNLTLSLCGGGWCKVIFMSNPTFELS